MPKVEYSKAKGLVQKSGSGFSVKDVPVVEEIESVTADANKTVKAHGTTLVTTSGGARDITVPAGSYAGQRKLVVLAVDDGNMVLKAETDGAGNDNDETVITATAVGDYALIMWIGDRWVTLSSVAT